MTALREVGEKKLLDGIREPSWERSRYGETESMRIGFLLITISRPIGTRGGPRPKLRTEVGGHNLKREFDDFPEAWAIKTAAIWLKRALDEAQKLADATPKATASRLPDDGKDKP